MKKIFHTSYCILIATIIITFSGFQSFAETPQKNIHQSEISANSRLTSVGFTLKNSMAGFGYNVITANVFDCVPGYGNPQTWKDGPMRYLKVRPGETVTIAGTFRYRTLFGKIHLKEFVRQVYIPINAKLVVIE